MARLTECTLFDGTDTKLDRLGLKNVWRQLESVLTDFEFRVAERKGANDGAVLHEVLHNRFRRSGGWVHGATDGVDWIKTHGVNGTRVCLGVQVQFSVPAKSDLLVVDIQYLIDQITAGRVDVGVIAVPSDKLASFLADHVAGYTDALKTIERMYATYLPLGIRALEHDGPGPALVKRRTRQGKKRTV